MSSSESGDETTVTPQDDDIKAHLKTLADKVSELETKKSRRSKAFRITKSQQMKRYHERKRNLEADNIRLMEEVAQLRSKLQTCESDLEKLRQPKHVEPKRRNLGFSDCFQRLDEHEFTISPFH